MKENEIGDQVEEALLQAHDAVQATLNGMWQELLGGCPHRHGVRDSVDICDANEMRPCIYETGDGSCELFQEIIVEWREELERDHYKEYLLAGIAPGKEMDND